MDVPTGVICTTVPLWIHRIYIASNQKLLDHSIKEISEISWGDRVGGLYLHKWL